MSIDDCISNWGFARREICQSERALRRSVSTHFDFDKPPSQLCRRERRSILFSMHNASIKHSMICMFHFLGLKGRSWTPWMLWRRQQQQSYFTLSKDGLVGGNLPFSFDSTWKTVEEIWEPRFIYLSNEWKRNCMPVLLYLHYHHLHSLSACFLVIWIKPIICLFCSENKKYFMSISTNCFQTNNKEELVVFLFTTLFVV